MISRPRSRPRGCLAAIDSDLGEVDDLIQELLLVDRLSTASVPIHAQAFGVL